MLTPIDIRNRQLKPKMGGYDKKDTDDFLEEIIASYEEMYNENRTLQEKITSLSEGIQYYKKMEGTLQKALVLAEKTSSETQEAAKSQADSMMSEASAKAEALSRETKAEIDALRAEAQAQAEVTKAKANRELEETRNHVRKLVQSYENYRLQFKKLAEAQIEMLDSESFSIFVPELDELMNEAPSADSVMDNPGVIPINIGSPAPFVEPPEEEPAEPPKVEEVSMDEESFTSISIPVTSSIEPFTSPQEDEEAASADVTSPTLDILVNSTPTIDINISSSIGEETEVHTEADTSSFAVDLGSINVPISTESFISPEQDTAAAASPSIDVPVTSSEDASVKETPSPEVPLGFESPADIPAVDTPVAETPSVEPTLDFVSPVDDTPAVESPAMEAPLNFESPTDIPAAPAADASVMPAFDMPAMEIPITSVPAAETPATDIPMMETPSMEVPLSVVPSLDNQTADPSGVASSMEMPMMDIPMVEPAAAETAPVTEQPVSTNGLIGVDPMDTMADMSPFMEPGSDFPQETPVEQAPSEPSTNGIISDAFLEPGNMFDSSISETPVEPVVEKQTTANDNIIDINPFNFIDPE
ncbi:MAG: DivIVA domain-containing protein [Eubacteriales bacterium]|nr:DivIVA domain-containing protein [Eubacteriales bacterium]